MKAIKSPKESVAPSKPIKRKYKAPDKLKRIIFESIERKKAGLSAEDKKRLKADHDHWQKMGSTRLKVGRSGRFSYPKLPREAIIMLYKARMREEEEEKKARKEKGTRHITFPKKKEI